jgi:hypothetical protein
LVQCCRAERGGERLCIPEGEAGHGVVGAGRPPLATLRGASWSSRELVRLQRRLEQWLLLGDECLLLLRRLRYGRQRRMAGTGPQLDGARLGVVDSGPAPGGEADGLGAPSLLLWLLLGGVMLLRRAAAATATPAAALAAAVGFGASAVPSA